MIDEQDIKSGIKRTVRKRSLDFIPIPKEPIAWQLNNILKFSRTRKPALCQPPSSKRQLFEPKKPRKANPTSCTCVSPTAGWSCLDLATPPQMRGFGQAFEQRLRATPRARNHDHAICYLPDKRKGEKPWFFLPTVLAMNDFHGTSAPKESDSSLF